MKLVIERIKGNSYAYTETEAQYKLNEKARRNDNEKRLNIKQLENECLLDSPLYENCYFVVDVKEKRNVKRKQAKKEKVFTSSYYYGK